jgi:hypothetical protein
MRAVQCSRQVGASASVAVKCGKHSAWTRNLVTLLAATNKSSAYTNALMQLHQCINQAFYTSVTAGGTATLVTSHTVHATVLTQINVNFSTVLRLTKKLTVA